MCAGRHVVVLADYEWGARLLGAGDQGWGSGELGSLRLLLFANLRRLSSQEVDSWLAAREAEALAGGGGLPPAPVPASATVSTPSSGPGSGPDPGFGLSSGSGSRSCANSGPGPSFDPNPHPAPAPAGIFNVYPTLGAEDFSAALDGIQALILAGETYQVNFSYRLDFQTFGSPFSLYRRLRVSQPVPFGALLALPPRPGIGAGAGTDTGTGSSIGPSTVTGSSTGEPTWILSCSPELFLRHQGGRLSARPMKGTAPRGADARTDAALARQLNADAKTRAENLMIVDLLRNDLGRLARTGSVRVPALFQVEAHPSLWQMTSTIEAELPPGVTFPQVLRDTFPCGSITGAPKHRTMHWIRQLETRPRGLYTGAIGWIDPPGGAGMADPRAGLAHRGLRGIANKLPASATAEAQAGGLVGGSARCPGDPAPACGDFCLSVAIRTLTLGAPMVSGSPLAPRPGTLGIGAGIVSDSQADQEYAECQLKARFLTALDPGFSLIETLHATHGDGVRHLDRHLARLRRSAECLGFRLPLADIRAALIAAAAALSPDHPWRLKLELRKDGHFTLGQAPLEPLPPGPVGLLIAPEPMDEADPLLAHKTSHRAPYDAAIATAVRQGAFDMLFCNRQGQVTEGGRTNLFAFLDGAWLTPPLAAGVLPGVMRGLILEDPAWGARETPLTLADLRRADRLLVTNALRGPIEARLYADQGQPRTGG
ncbi:MAG: chloride transporter [Gammaproteobacteria bacterium]|nr:MAG: chloride transporter [Gammaproteobacteria bacterium]